MRPSRWTLALALLFIASMSIGEINGTLVDSDGVTASATGYVPLMWNQTTAVHFQAGTVSGTDSTSNPGNVVLGTNGPSSAVYAAVGGTSQSFYRYSTNTNSWSSMASLPGRMGNGASMVFDQSRYIYTIQGTAGRNLYRYDLSINAWSDIGDTPAAVGAGGNLAWDGQSVYVLQGSTGSAIWKFDPATGGWTTLTATPQRVGTGASLLFENGALYVTRGGNSATVWKYALTGQWTTLANSRGNIGAGADMVGGVGDLIYCSYGGSNQRLTERYDPATNAWTTRLQQPSGVGAGGGLAYDGSTSIYSMSGNGQNRFYLYSMTSNSWTSRANLPAVANAGGCMVYTPALTIYRPTGTFTSSTFDTGAAGTKYIQAFWDTSLPTSTTVTLEVRASDGLSGGTPNAAWRSLGGGSDGPMAGMTGRYVQWRVTLTTADISATPMLQEVRIFYRPA